MNRRINIKNILELKNKEKIVALTCYTSLTAEIIDQHTDLILVGDSLGMTIYGFKNTLNVTLRMMIDHGNAVVRATKKAFVVVDMPFGSYEGDKNKAFDNAAKLISETGAQALKLEGGYELEETVYFLSQRGIPIMGHIGLMPQKINTFGNFSTQGKDKSTALKIMQDAKSLSEAGVFSMVIEAVPELVGKKITSAIKIPTVGIGAGKHCDGQILVIDDLLGLYKDFKPKFAKQYVNLNNIIAKAVVKYKKDVKNIDFPFLENTY